MSKTTTVAAAALAATALSGAAAAQPILDPAAQAFVDSLAGGKPIYTMTPTEARGALSGAQAIPVAKLPARIEDKVFPVGPTGSVRVRIVRPEGVKGKLPVVLHIHGGGWVLGGVDTHDRLTREIAVGAKAAVLFVDYDRSPEARYPVAVEQAYAALQYFIEHADQFEVDASRLAIVGDSVGGNMSAALTLMSKARKGPKFDLQVLLYPVTDANFETGSYTTFAEGPWLTRKAMQWFWDAYAPDAASRKQPTVAPLQASVEELKGLPEAVVIVDENDVLRDEGEAYARKLLQAGVRVTSTRYNGTIHDFMMLNAVAETPATRAAVLQANTALYKALHK
ncbi:alpha/beta hydrolase [Caulobacter endophyticus]|uniref:alpha/beta hydrolase n=1 Tax=Caulobacter endophyticus TaxID=2172652 RepID=UPI00240E9F86|nr:alpha/beta hydrolase [Caulobacter endophyticus]MDG2529002.1 alpha/beta hydrolase [Caulobacter endophyticus]